jgi:rhamnogalacturonyl hydrolase YesR
VSHKVGGQWEPRPDNANLQHYVGGTFQNVATLSPPPQHTDHSQFIRYEGPGIESDKVGYRIYLDWRNGFDIFGKKLSEPVLARVGLDGYESYHHMADWGMDILKVGQSLGCGGFGFWDKRKVELVSKVDGWNVEITNQGPLYSSFQITYKNWKIAGKTLDVIADFSMTAGSRLVHTRLRLSEELPKLAIGLVKHPGTELIQGPKDLTGKAYTFVGSWGKQALNEDVLGMAVLFQSGDRVSQETDAANYVSVVKPAGKAFSYYFLAAWGSEPDGIQTQEQFSQYLAHEAKRLTLEPRVRLGTALAESTKTFPITAASALDWSKKLADSELERKALLYHYDGWDTNRRRKPEFEYDIVGLQPLAYDELSQVAGNAKYAQVSEKVTGSFVTPQGKLLAYDQANYNIDSVMPGRVLLRLYQQTQQNKYKLAAQQLRQQLQRQPKTSGGAFWHKQRYPWQLWLDGVYMALPFLAEYSMLFEKGSSLDEVVTEFQVTRQQLRNPANGLYFHAWDEKRKQSWADPKTGLSRYHWGRGMGWFAMALVDTLDYIPEADAEHRAPLLELINEVAPALVKVQDPATGTWWQILDMPDEAGNYRESTASAMFAYFFTKAVRQGYLPEAYKAVAEKAYAGLIREFVNVHPDGKISMTNQCLVAGLGFGRDGSYRYYMSEPVVENDPKGNGPFILAGIEMHRLLSR